MSRSGGGDFVSFCKEERLFSVTALSQELDSLFHVITLQYQFINKSLCRYGNNDKYPAKGLQQQSFRPVLSIYQIFLDFVII